MTVETCGNVRSRPIIRAAVFICSGNSSIGLKVHCFATLRLEAESNKTLCDIISVSDISLHINEECVAEHEEYNVSRVINERVKLR
jgi:hypothetical protein